MLLSGDIQVSLSRYWIYKQVPYLHQAHPVMSESGLCSPSNCWHGASSVCVISISASSVNVLLFFSSFLYLFWFSAKNKDIDQLFIDISVLTVSCNCAYSNKCINTLSCCLCASPRLMSGQPEVAPGLHVSQEFLASDFASSPGRFHVSANSRPSLPGHIRRYFTFLSSVKSASAIEIQFARALELCLLIGSIACTPINGRGSQPHHSNESHNVLNSHCFLWHHVMFLFIVHTML